MKIIEDNLSRNIIPLFVFGTLMSHQRFYFYLKGAKFIGRYYTQGQLMKAPNGSVYIDKDYKAAATLGELYQVNYHSLQSINHLEVLSGEFPVGYELGLTRAWPYNKEKKIDFSSQDSIYVFYYRRKNKAVKIVTGDYNDDFDTLEELKNFLISNEQVSSEGIIKHMLIKMSIWDYE